MDVKTWLPGAVATLLAVIAATANESVTALPALLMAVAVLLVPSVLLLARDPTLLPALLPPTVIGAFAIAVPVWMWTDFIVNFNLFGDDGSDIVTPTMVALAVGGGMVGSLFAAKRLLPHDATGDAA